MLTEKEWEKVNASVDNLGCSIAEAIELLEYDKKIDKGEKTEYDLTPEQQKVAKKYTNVTEHKKPAVYQWSTREKKADTTKEGVIQTIFDFLSENGYESVEITNKSKLIAFKIGEDSYELDLKRKRKPKN